MKKTLIALAALAAAGAVSAQSAVTLYGRLDLGLSTTSSEWTNQTGAVVQKMSSTSLAGAASQYSGSRLGVRGTEDLGGGMSAFFDYALNINPDTTGSAVGTTRLAYAGLRGGFGTVTIGTFDNALDSTRGLGNAGSKNFADAFGQEAATTQLGGSNGIAAEFDAAGHVSAKSQNAISYQTPSMGGFSGQLSLSSEISKNEVGATISDTKGSTGVLGLSYAAGPIEARFAYAKQKADTPAVAAVTATAPVTGADEDGDPITGIATVTTAAAVPASNTSASDWVLSASYDLGVANPRLIYERSEGKTVGTNIKRKVSYYAISSDFDLGAFTPWVTLAYGKFTSNNSTVVNVLNANASTTSIKQRGYELGVSYTLSQRTSLYSFYNSERAKLDNQHKFTTDNLAVGVLHTF